MQSTGCSPGYPDLFIHRRGHDGEIGLAVELKVEDKRLTRAQKKWRDALVAEGCQFAVIHSVAEFKQTLDTYLHGLPTRVARPRPSSHRGTAAMPIVFD